MEENSWDREKRIRAKYDAINERHAKVAALWQTFEDNENEWLLGDVLSEMYHRRTKEGREELKVMLQTIISQM